MKKVSKEDLQKQGRMFQWFLYFFGVVIPIFFLFGSPIVTGIPMTFTGACSIVGVEMFNTFMIWLFGRQIKKLAR